MKAELYKDQIKQLLAMVEAGKGDEAEIGHVMPVAEFLDPKRLEDERNLFKQLPLIVGHTDQICQPGDYFVKELDDRSWLIVRGKDGKARAFYNYCQHRGTKLVHEQKGQCQHRFVCPYHAWTYNNSGKLVGVPRADLFPGLDKTEKSLKSADLQEAYGLLWLTQNAEQASPIDNYLGEVKDGLAAMGLENYHLYFDKTRELKASWKFPLFAFLEAYHLPVLHKQSIGDFFVENVSHSELLGRHIRSFVPRQNVIDLVDADLSQTNLSDYVTPTHILFPNVCMIEHPTSLSILSMFPGSTPGTSSWRHMLLTPKVPDSDAERAHYDKTIAVLDGMTYEKEDFWISEQAQEGINAGAISEFSLSKNEYMIKVFNDLVTEHLAELKR